MSRSENFSLFAIVDGDDVGNKVESRILANDVTGFVSTSEMISAAMERTADRAARVPGVMVISTGGDSILLQLDDDSVAELVDVLEALQRPGYITFSVGVGGTLQQSFIALRMAKSSGKCKIVIHPDC
ncbi:mCpol domain-containing protein [Streptomyces microflavus]|uniref:mCpol domain-containing protein n=1 Tax=Streptomyces microflavus TaxID=1919 RepID=UPI0037B78FF1